MINTARFVRLWLGTAATCGFLLPFPGFAQQPPNIGVAPVLLTESSYTFDTAEQHKIHVVVVAKGLKHPFSLALLPSGDALVSERGGPMRLVHNVGGAAGAAPSLDPEPIAGVPAAPAYRNGGLHEIVLHPQFAKTQVVYFTFNEPGKAGDPTAKPPTHQESVLAVFRARLAGHALTHVERIFSAGESGYTGGSRRGEVPRTGGLERVVLNDKLEDVRRETLLTDLHQRIRDVRQGVDGLLYMITDEDDGALLRIEPAM